MALQFSTGLRAALITATTSNANLNPGGGGASPFLYVRTGSPPASPSASITGTQLAAFPLPTTGTGGTAWTLSTGVATLSPTWQDLSADSTGTAGWFYIGPPDGNSISIMGSVGVSGSGADMIVDNTSFLTGQAFSVLSFTLTEGNA